MSYYDREYYNEDYWKYRRAVSDMERQGFKVESSGRFDDPDKPWRTGGYIDSNDEIHRDM